jgi:hypothetical protein
MQNDDFEQQLLAFPLDEPVAIDGQSAYLRVDPDGAELAVLFLDTASGRQLQDALQLGFQSALEFDAGWAMTADGSSLLLSRWLPGAEGWADAAEALDQLLNQVELLRSLVTITGGSDHSLRRDERFIRSKIMGVN